MLTTAISRLSKIFNHRGMSTKRRRQSAVLSGGADVLEDRRMLTNAAPEIAFAQGVNGILYMVVEDDTPNVSLTLEVDVFNDGTTDFSFTLGNGDDTIVGLGMLIPPNQNTPVGLKLTETTYNEFAIPIYLTDTMVVQAQGVVVNPTPFVWIAGSSGAVAGEIDTDGSPTTVHLLYREVGQTTWIEKGLLTDGTFVEPISEADGVKDFEFATATRHSSVSEMSPIVTINDLEAGSNTGASSTPSSPPTTSSSPPSPSTSATTDPMDDEYWASYYV